MQWNSIVCVCLSVINTDQIPVRNRAHFSLPQMTDQAIDSPPAQNPKRCHQLPVCLCADLFGIEMCMCRFCSVCMAGTDWPILQCEKNLSEVLSEPWTEEGVPYVFV